MADNLSGTAPGAKVGGPDRRTAEGGAVVDGFYIPPGTFGGTPATPPVAIAPTPLAPTPSPTSGGGEMCFGVAKPTAGLRQGYEWYCNQETRQWDTRC